MAGSTLGPLVDWIVREPVAGLLALVTAALLFGAAYTASRQDGGGFGSWIRRLVEALSATLLFLGLIGGFYFLLDSNYTTFSSLHGPFSRGGSLSFKEWQEARATWGDPLTQYELTVSHTFEEEVVEEIPRPDKPPLFRNTTEVKELPQESLVGFRGVVDIHQGVSGTPSFNVFNIVARYEYQVVNQSDIETTAEFSLPLSPDHPLERVSVTFDDREVPSLRVNPQAISWDVKMRPRQKSRVVLSYTTTGMEAFSYRVSEQREIRDFTLTISVESDNFYPVTSPEASAIRLDDHPTDSGSGRILTWTIDRAVMAPILGVTMWQRARPYAPFDETIRILRNAAQALLLLLGVASMTLMICGSKFDLRQLALLAAVFCAQFLALMGMSLWLPAYKITLAMLSVMTLILSYFISRKLSRLPQVLVMIMVAFFSFGYPHAGLLPDGPQRNTFDGIVQASLIVYFFGLSLYVRVRNIRRINNAS
jgi:hypothetical protein